MDPNHALRLAMFTGKGGVGKTTLSCGFARRWAQQFSQDRVLLLSTDPAHSLGDVLQTPVENKPRSLKDLPNLMIRALDAQLLLRDFKQRYGATLELLVERGSFVGGADLAPVWDLNWPGLDELMALLEIQRLLGEAVADRIVVDMAPSGHTLNLFKLMDVLDQFLGALDLFQEKHRWISQRFTGQYNPDAADDFLQTMQQDLAMGRQLLQDSQQTACMVVAIAEPMSWLESKRLLSALHHLQIPIGGIWVNRVLSPLGAQDLDSVPSDLLADFAAIAQPHPLWIVPLQGEEPIGETALDALMTQVYRLGEDPHSPQRDRSTSNTDGLVANRTVSITDPLLCGLTPIPPSLPDFLDEGRRLILVGGKGGVGKTTVAAAIAWALSQAHPQQRVRVISIDPAHSLGDAFGQALGHEAVDLTENLSGQEMDADLSLEQFREEYLWELAAMMSGEDQAEELQVAYGPQAWKQLAAQALPGVDEMLALIGVIELLETQAQNLIILDTAPTGHLLRFLEMPTALSDWLAWIFKLWMKYQDVVGRVDLIGRLRTLRQRAIAVQRKLKDPQHTEFIGVVQHQSAILAETQRLNQTLSQMGISQRYIVHNCYQAEQDLPAHLFATQTVARLPLLPPALAPFAQVQLAARLLF